ncbi:MAG: FHA domain-containing protein [Bacteroidaceae bacterium]|nr:FHA domain-containing protein [Bacteroidaceae bacterium]
MKIIIGRDPASGCLRVKRDNEKPQLVKNTEGIPPYVSKEHFMLESDKGEDFVLTNLNEENVTYVDNVPVVRYMLKRGTPLAVGMERYPISWKSIDPFLPKFADIRHLKVLWENYQTDLMNLTIAQQKAGTKQMLTMIFSLGGGLLGSAATKLFDIPENMTFVITAIPIVLALIFVIFMFIKRNREAEFFPLERKRLEKEFKAQYKCPVCGTPFGMVDYDMLSTRPGCATCKSKFVTS